MEETVKYLKALIALQAAAYETSEASEKAEVLLSRAGLSHGEIAELLGKSYAAVAKTMSRFSKSKKEGVG